jgi:hypothetical protein
MRLIFIFLFTMLLGVGIAAAVAALVGLFLRTGKVPVFLLVAVWWLWTGWKYAKARDEGQF